MGEKTVNHQYDVWEVRLDVEYLPGHTIDAICSLDYRNIELAKRSLEHVRQDYPKARLFYHGPIDQPEPSYLEHLARIEARDKKYLNRLEANV